MDLDAVYTEIEGKAATTGLRVVKWGEKPQPPAAMLLLPQGVARQTYRGVDKIADVVLLVVVGRANQRSALKAMFAYAASSGAKSVTLATDSAFTAYATCSDVTLREITFDTVTIAGATDVFLGALFHYDITGPGA